MIYTIFVRAAAALLPPNLYGRYRDEWTAEAHIVRHQQGQLAALGFAGSLVPAAARTTLQVRSNDKSSYAELSIAALCALPPVVFLVVYGVLSGVWVLAGAQSLSLLGIVLAAHGLWQNDGRVLDSMSSRFGLVLALVGATLGIVLVENLPALAAINPDEVIPSEIPNATIPIGFFVLVVASYFEQKQRRLQLIALAILAPGGAAAVIVAAVNAVNSSGISSVLSLLYGVPVLGLAWASYIIADRSRSDPGQTPETLANT